MPVPTPTMPGAGYEELLYRGQALAQLRILKQQMALGNLKIANRTVNLGYGVTCFCNICFNREEAFILLEKSDESGISGFACIPRTGEITVSVLQFNSYGDEGIATVQGGGYYLAGDQWNAYTSVSPYPMWNQANLSHLLQRVNGDWRHEHKPLLYGNIDWKGKAQDGRPVLTWKGPPSRHFPLANTITAYPGFTELEHTLTTGDMMEHYTPFSRFIYENGTILATAPRTRFPGSQVMLPNLETGGTNNHGFILAAAYQQVAAQKILIAIVSANYSGYPDGISPDGRTGTTHVYKMPKSPAVLALPPIVNDGNWEYIGKTDSNLPANRPWFFNESGTEAVMVDDALVLHRLVIDATPDSSSVVHTSENTWESEFTGVLNGTDAGNRDYWELSSGSYNQANLPAEVPPSDNTNYHRTSSGPNTRNYTTTAHWSAVIAADFKGDVLVKAVVDAVDEMLDHAQSQSSGYEGNNFKYEIGYYISSWDTSGSEAVPIYDFGLTRYEAQYPGGQFLDTEASTHYTRTITLNGIPVETAKTDWVRTYSKTIEGGHGISSYLAVADCQVGGPYPYTGGMYNLVVSSPDPPPQTSIESWSETKEDHRLRSSICYLDLRNDIYVTKETRQDAGPVTEAGSYSPAHLDGMHPEAVIGAEPATQIVVRIRGTVIHSAPSHNERGPSPWDYTSFAYKVGDGSSQDSTGYDEFNMQRRTEIDAMFLNSVTTPVADTISYPYGETYTDSTTGAVTTHSEFSSELTNLGQNIVFKRPVPLGSWAVDRAGNIFISQCTGNINPDASPKDTQVFNALVPATANPVAVVFASGKAVPGGPNPVFFPIAPL